MPASFGAPLFVLAGTAERATLVRRDKRVVTARADDIIEALTGLKLGPRELLAVLAGCADQTPAFSSAAQFGDLVAVTTARARVFLRQREARWQVAAAELSPLLLEYLAMDGSWPARIRITSSASSSLEVRISVALSQIDVNTPIAASVFVPNPPAGAIPMTIEQLRQSGPMAGRQ